MGRHMDSSFLILKQSVHFYKLCSVNPDPVFLLNSTPIAVIEQVKFFGLIFDK